MGRSLVRAAEAWLRERGVRKVLLLVRRENAGVAGFYRRPGFAASDLALMQRRLAGDEG